MNRAERLHAICRLLTRGDPRSWDSGRALCRMEGIADPGPWSRPTAYIQTCHDIVQALLDEQEKAK